jgi:hypothetical protein
MSLALRVTPVSLGLALLSLCASACAVDRTGAGRIGVDGSVAVRDAGRRDASGDGATSGDDGGVSAGEGGTPGGDGGISVDGGVVSADSGPPPDVDFEVRVDGSECGALTPCGGALEGTWQVSGGCVAFTQVNTLRSACPGATISGTGTARGRVTFAGGTMTRDIDIDWRGSVGIPGSCAVIAGGCGGVESTIRRFVPGATVSCPGDGSGGCACSLSIVSTITGSSAYLIDGNQIVRDDRRRWNYCVTDASMEYRETTGAEPGTFAFMRP